MFGGGRTAQDRCCQRPLKLVGFFSVPRPSVSRFIQHALLLGRDPAKSQRLVGGSKRGRASPFPAGPLFLLVPDEGIEPPTC